MALFFCTHKSCTRWTKRKLYSCTRLHIYILYKMNYNILTRSNKTDLNSPVIGGLSSENSDCKRLNTCKVKIRYGLITWNKSVASKQISHCGKEYHRPTATELTILINLYYVPVSRPSVGNRHASNTEVATK